MRVTSIGDLEFMGDRRNVRIEFPQGNDIYLYAHWDGIALPLIVAKALKRSEGRWGDPSYLSRIIFSEMIKDDLMGETGYGISPTRDDYDRPDIVISWGDYPDSVGGPLYVREEPDDNMRVEEWIKRYKV